MPISAVRPLTPSPMPIKPTRFGAFSNEQLRQLAISDLQHNQVPTALCQQMKALQVIMANPKAAPGETLAASTRYRKLSDIFAEVSLARLRQPGTDQESRRATSSLLQRLRMEIEEFARKNPLEDNISDELYSVYTYILLEPGEEE